MAEHGARTALSRSLRRNSTEAESALWAKLRNKHLDGFDFRRQHPIGPYGVDLVCLTRRLVVEVDGGHHGESKAIGADEVRTRWLEARGYTVVRLWNNEVLSNAEGAVQVIREAVHGGSPSPRNLAEKWHGIATSGILGQTS